MGAGRGGRGGWRARHPDSLCYPHLACLRRLSLKRGCTPGPSWDKAFLLVRLDLEQGLEESRSLMLEMILSRSTVPSPGTSFSPSSGKFCSESSSSSTSSPSALSSGPEYRSFVPYYYSSLISSGSSTSLTDSVCPLPANISLCIAARMPTGRGKGNGCPQGGSFVPGELLPSPPPHFL